MEKNELEKLREYCKTVWECNSEWSSRKMLEHHLSYYLFIIQKTSKRKNKDLFEKDATIINQMMFSKLLHVKKIFEGVNYEDFRLGKLNNIIDPGQIAILVRNMFETVVLFHLVYTFPNTEEKKKLMYNLWVISGLKYRQRFEVTAKKK